jgi:hypothetical protein
MLRSRLPAASRQSRRTLPELPAQRPAAPDLSPSPADLLFSTWPGRLFLVAAALKLLVAVLRRVTGVPGAIELLSSAATIGLMVSVGYFVWRLFLLMKRRLLWRVRRKLILSYIFIGVVPALLDHRVLHARRVGDLDQRQRLPVPRRLRRHGQLRRAGGQGRGGGGRTESCNRRRDRGARAAESSNASRQYRRLSIVFVPIADGRRRSCGPASGAMPPRRPHPGVADGNPRRVRRHRRAAAAERGGDVQLIARAAVPVQQNTRRLGYVIVDIPVDGQIFDSLYESTGSRPVW